MGNMRSKPEFLGAKLRQVRLALGLSQSEMLKRLEAEDKLDNARISGFESGLREPTLEILLQYARIARVNMEAIIDDELNLPNKLPDTINHEDIKRHYATRRKQR